MIDLHCHLLPGIDDGAADLDVSFAMARAFVADGVVAVACTPHILPGIYPNTGHDIRSRVAALQQELDRQGIALQLLTGADNHVVPTFVPDIQRGHLLTLGDTRYVLVEPPHHVLVPKLDDFFFSILVAGYVPILTHPERLSWIKGNFDLIRRLYDAGVWMQITAGSLTGAFGSGPRYWAEKMLDEGLVHLLATDAHDVKRRPPNLAEGYEAAAVRIGQDEALHLVYTRPLVIVRNEPPTAAPPTLKVQTEKKDVYKTRQSSSRHQQGTAPAPMDSPSRGGLLGGLRRLFD